ncbi:integrator complex subunit 3 [Selaginella moellendorffii]|uniref:integrator complex subunit 3 n=1 Tax=Selaginella moellendorffii TaxID=88036 RepID=UPI000D1C6315|nr:integrator complex subunit 3 [Selaginella moellendorffii]|eukprot:XP_024538045.1 integrator complex subunit 3 [Selaginella moellendorffii]
MTSKLLHRGSHEAQDELEIILSQAYSTFQAQLSASYLSTVPPAQRGPLTQALLYAILIQPQGGGGAGASSATSSSATSLINQLTTITTDGYAAFVGLLLRLVNDSYAKLLEHPRGQIIWLLKQLIEFYATDVDNLCLLLLRQIVGGDTSPTNVWLAMQMLEVLTTKISWVTSNHGLLTSAVYTYLRLLPDHSMAKNSSVNELRQAEIKFCASMIREHFQECLGIGRDLIRLLQDVSSIAEFDAIWRDLLANPASFRVPSFTDIGQLYVVKTHTRYFQSRLTPEMEAQIKFMLTHVRMGSQRRYQGWFTQRFLSTPESETLVCDLIRYVCCVHHPSNQILQSDILPRWALIGWLLKCCKSNHVEANAKLALLYDWLFFVPKTDNIMNIEPGILVMFQSIPKYVDMTNSLLEFLFLLMEHYDPPRKELLHRGVAASVEILVGKGVVRNLEPLATAPAIALPLREKLSQLFPLYCKVEGAGDGLKLKPLGKLAVREESEDKGEVDTTSESVIRKRRRTGVHDPNASELISHLEKFSKALALSQDAAIKVLESSLGCLTSQERAEKFASQVTDITKKAAYDLFSPLAATPTTKAEGDETMSLTSSLLRLYVGFGYPHVRTMLLFWSREGFAVGPRLLCYVSRLAEELETKDYVLGILKSKDADQIKAEASDISDEDGEATRAPETKRLQRQGSSATQKSLRKRFHNAVAEAFKAYEEFQRSLVLINVAAESVANPDEEVRFALLNDLKTCLVWNVARLQRVLPSVCRYLPNLAVGYDKFMHLMVSVLGPAEILSVEFRLALGEFPVIGSAENLARLVKASLAWDSIEQHYFWKLLIAEVQGCGPLTSLEVLKLCSSCVNPESDVEAMSGMLSLLRSSTPSTALSSALLLAPPSFADLAVAVFTSWFLAFFPALASSLGELEEKLSSGGGGKISPAMAEALISHFESFDLGEDTRPKEAGEIKQAFARIVSCYQEDNNSETT